MFLGALSISGGNKKKENQDKKCKFQKRLHAREHQFKSYLLEPFHFDYN